MKDPYKILDMPEDADFDSLKAKYEELKAKYGEERFLPGEEGAQGALKLTELEDAWSIIESRHREAEDEQKYGTGFDGVRSLILEKRYDEAQQRLDAMPKRDGEWHYYQSIIYYKREWLNDCYTHLKEAVRLCPDNQTYKDSLAKLSKKLANPEIPPEQLGGTGAGGQAGPAVGNCLGDCCTTLCCIECLSLPCRMCGG